MHSLFCKLFISSLIILFSSIYSFGQYYEAGIKLGALTYWGDLNTPDVESNLTNSRIGAGVFMKYNFNGFFGIKGDLMLGQLSGDDSKSYLDWQINRNLSFKSILAEMSMVGELNLFEYNASKGDHIFTPYIQAGFSAFYFSPKALYMGKYYDLQELGTEGQGIPGYGSKYSKFSAALLLGSGVKFKLNESLNLGVGIVLRRTFTDYLDDVSKGFVDSNILKEQNGPIADALSNRSGEVNEERINWGNNRRGGQQVYDYFVSTMVTISYNFVGRNSLRIFKKRGSVNCPSL